MMATPEHPAVGAFRTALLERARTIIAGAVHDEDLRVQRDVRVAQEMVDIHVSTPPWCDPATSTIRTTASGTIRAATALQAVRALQRPAIADELTNAAAILFAERTGAPLIVTPATRDAIVAQLGVTMEGLVQQTVRGRQVIQNVQGRVCNVVMDNTFIVNLAVGAYAEDAVATLLAAPEVWSAINASWPPPAPSPPVPVTPDAGPSGEPAVLVTGLVVGTVVLGGMAVLWWWWQRRAKG